MFSEKSIEISLYFDFRLNIVQKTKLLDIRLLIVNSLILVFYSNFIYFWVLIVNSLINENQK